jgi:hypothetical protein
MREKFNHALSLLFAAPYYSTAEVLFEEVFIEAADPSLGP